MALIIYDKHNNVENQNDIYFDENCLIKNDKFTNYLLNTVENAQYYSNNKFIGRDGQLVQREQLSTGVKTLLNIYYNKDTVFDLVECGSNILKALFKINNGKCLWSNHLCYIDDDFDCDIEYRNIKFSTVYKFLDYYCNTWQKENR